MNIFISYRRADTEPVARAVQQKLKQAPDVGRVFLDHDGIKKAENFIKAITRALKRSRACLVLIGPAWRAIDPVSGVSRLDNPEDMVRCEVEQALARCRRVVPVLVGDARMPTADTLPESLRPLTTLNAARLRQEDFEEDMDDVLDAAFGSRRRISRWATPRMTPFRAARLLTYGLLTAAALVVGVGLINRALDLRSPLNDEVRLYDLNRTIQAAVGLEPGSPQHDPASLTIMGLVLFIVFVIGAATPFLFRYIKRAFSRRI